MKTQIIAIIILVAIIAGCTTPADTEYESTDNFIKTGIITNVQKERLSIDLYNGTSVYFSDGSMLMFYEYDAYDVLLPYVDKYVKIEHRLIEIEYLDYVNELISIGEIEC